jgi:hypothetical protein
LFDVVELFLDCVVAHMGIGPKTQLRERASVNVPETAIELVEPSPVLGQGLLDLFEDPQHQILGLFGHACFPY